MIHAAPVGELHDLALPVGVRPIVDAAVCPEAARTLELLIARRSDQHARTGEAGELQREDRYAAGPDQQYGLARRDAAQFDQRPPRGHGRTRQRGRGFERQMSGYGDRGLLVEDGVFGEDAVGRRRAERDEWPLRRSTVDPVAEECAGDPLADAKAAYGGPCRNDLSRAVGQRNDIAADRAAHVMAASDHEVAVVQGSGPDAHQNLRRPGFGIRAFAAAQRVDGTAAGDEFIGAHGISLRIRPLITSQDCLERSTLTATSVHLQRTDLPAARARSALGESLFTPG